MKRRKGVATSGRALIVSGLLHWREEEGGILRETIAGFFEAVEDRDGLEVQATDCRTLFRVEVRDGRMELIPTGRAWRALLAGPDVAWFLPVFPPILHLVGAVLVRLRGAHVMCSPMSMLGTDFARESWFRPPGRVWGWVRPRVVALLRSCWKWIAHEFVCLSAEEARQLGLPARRIVLAPWSAPATSLRFAADAAGPLEETGRTGPIAVISRFDWRRKGFDRMVAWIEAYEERLPRPAVVLFVRGADALPPRLARLVDMGLVSIVSSNRGADLMSHLHGCRGAMLLSRWEGQPRALLEAAIAGLPTISNESCNFREITELLGKGHVVDHGDPAAVQAAFEALPAADRDGRGARDLLDRHRIGRFLVGVLSAVAQGREPDERSYFRWVAAGRHEESAMGTG